MSVTTTPRPLETRVRIPDVGFHVYETLVRGLPANTPIRVAYDGRDMEIMVKGPIHNNYAWLLDRFIVVVARAAGLQREGLGETTWIRPEVARGLEADECFVFESAKLDKVRDLLAQEDNDVAGYPNPDLAVEVDLSYPQADREAIYAALRVLELWIFDGQVVAIRHLGADDLYFDAGQSRFLPVRAEEVTRWIVAEDTRDKDAWEERLRAWATAELPGRVV